MAVKFINRLKITPELWVTDLEDPSGEKTPLEIDIIKNISHPNIIGYVSHYVQVDSIILVTEFHGSEWNSSNPAVLKLNAASNVSEGKNENEHEILNTNT